MIKKFLLSLGIALVATSAWAGSDQTASFNIQYDLDATAITYCRMTGKLGDPFGAGIASVANITTSGSSTTTTALVASSAPFAQINVGDVLIVASSTGVATDTLFRVVTAKASSDSITVNTAWDLSTPTAGFAFTWKKISCGTGASNGWITIANSDSFAITFELDQVNATGGIDVQVQCRSAAIGASPVQIFPACTSGSCNTVQNYTTAGIASSTTVSFNSIPYQECRVGIFIHTSDDGGDTGANAEQIDIYVTKFLASR